MPRLAWLTARPIAHRGLHDATAGIIENTASAFAAAIAGGYGIETDLQISADGEAFVHHDDALGRLTEGSGHLAAMTAREIEAVRFKATRDRIMTLGDLCDFVAGRATLVIELKSHFDGDRRLVQRSADVLANYRGPVAVMSFDPAMIEVVRWIAPHLTRGVIAERYAPLIKALYGGENACDIETEVTFEDGRKGRLAAHIKIRDMQTHKPSVKPALQKLPLAEHAA